MSSEPASPLSILSDEEIITCTMADVVEEYDTDKLIDYLRRKNLKLKKPHFEIFRQREITGPAFIEMVKEDFGECEFEISHAIILSKYVEKLNEQKLGTFSSYKTIEELKKVFRKYKVNSEEITYIKQFNPDMQYFD